MAAPARHLVGDSADQGELRARARGCRLCRSVPMGGRWDQPKQWLSLARARAWGADCAVSVPGSELTLGAGAIDGDGVADGLPAAELKRPMINKNDPSATRSPPNPAGVFSISATALKNSGRLGTCVGTSVASIPSVAFARQNRHPRAHARERAECADRDDRGPSAGELPRSKVVSGELLHGAAAAPTPGHSWTLSRADPRLISPTYSPGLTGPNSISGLDESSPDAQQSLYPSAAALAINT